MKLSALQFAAWCLDAIGGAKGETIRDIARSHTLSRMIDYNLFEMKIYATAFGILTFEIHLGDDEVYIVRYAHIEALQPNYFSKKQSRAYYLSKPITQQTVTKLRLYV